MIHVDFNPSRLTGKQLEWWNEWQAKADAATTCVVDKWEATGEISSKEDFDSEIWGKLKEWLLKHYFNYKCGYCEADTRRTRKEMEHYRPKAGVNYRDSAGSKSSKHQKCSGMESP